MNDYEEFQIQEKIGMLEISIEDMKATIGMDEHLGSKQTNIDRLENRIMTLENEIAELKGGDKK